MELDKPIVGFDFETTGLNVNEDQIVQFAFIKQNIDGTQTRYKKLVKPSIVIPQAAIDIHGITNEMVENAKPFSYYAKGILNSIKGCYLCGHNIRVYDVPLLVAELHRVGIFDHGVYDMLMIDTKVLYRLYRPGTLIAAFADLCGGDLADAHDAEADTDASLDVVGELAVKWGIIDPQLLVEKSTPEGEVDLAGRLVLDCDGDISYSFGKYKGRKIKDVHGEDPGYRDWIIHENFSQQTKDILIREL